MAKMAHDLPQAESPPEWLVNVRVIHSLEIYSPLAIDRQGERMAWSLAVAVLALLVFLRWRMQTWALALLILFGLLLLAGIMISFGGWMERNTRIEADPQEIRYRNPLRVRKIRWPEIRRVSAYPRGSGWRVHVESQREAFTFQSRTVIGTGLGKPLETGVEGGVALVSAIAGMAHLDVVIRDGDGWACTRSEA
jgi:hypothetical protein